MRMWYNAQLTGARTTSLNSRSAANPALLYRIMSNPAQEKRAGTVESVPQHQLKGTGSGVWCCAQAPQPMSMDGANSRRSKRQAGPLESAPDAAGFLCGLHDKYSYSYSRAEDLCRDADMGQLLQRHRIGRVVPSSHPKTSTQRVSGQSQVLIQYFAPIAEGRGDNGSRVVLARRICVHRTPVEAQCYSWPMPGVSM